jgi:hypothetical protein
MVELTETTIAMGVTVVGIVGTLIWYGLAWYGIRTLQGVHDAVNHGDSTGE